MGPFPEPSFFSLKNTRGCRTVSLPAPKGQTSSCVLFLLTVVVTLCSIKFL